MEGQDQALCVAQRPDGAFQIQPFVITTEVLTDLYNAPAGE